MTGTSLDGLDIAIVGIDGHGLNLSATLLQQGSFNLGDLAESLRKLADDSLVKPSEILQSF